MNSLLVAECGMNVHHKCEKKVANLCGVNQKLMAEALAMIGSKQQVRRAKSSAPDGTCVLRREASLSQIVLIWVIFASKCHCFLFLGKSVFSWRFLSKPVKAV